MRNHGLWEPDEQEEQRWMIDLQIPPARHSCKEMVTTDDVVVGIACGAFWDDEPWEVGVDAETYYREIDEALKSQGETDVRRPERPRQNPTARPDSEA